jgi:hypothetical protein
LYADPDPDPAAQINTDPCGSGSGSETLVLSPKYVLSLKNCKDREIWETLHDREEIEKLRNPCMSSINQSLFGV